jgi:hypothetical protein
MSVHLYFVCMYRSSAFSLTTSRAAFVFAACDVIVDHQMTSGTLNHWWIKGMLVVWCVAVGTVPLVCQLGSRLLVGTMESV